MTRFLQGKWTYTQYWKRNEQYPIVIIGEYCYGSVQLYQFVKYTTKVSNIKGRLQDLKNQYGYNHGYKAHTLTQEEYNGIIDDLEAGRDPGLVENRIGKGSTGAKMKNTYPYIIWDLGQAKVSGVFPEKALAQDHAKGCAQRTPANKFVLLVALEEYFQPVNVTVEPVNLQDTLPAPAPEVSSTTVAEIAPQVFDAMRP